MARNSTTPRNAPQQAGATALRDQLDQLVPSSIGAVTAIQQAVADRVGLHTTDLKCLRHLHDGPRTAGELMEATGLTSGAMTRLIDRLESAGFVRRIDDPADRRRVVVEALPAALERLAPVYELLSRNWSQLLRRYSAAELEVLVDFFTRMRTLALDEVAEINAME